MRQKGLHEPGYLKVTSWVSITGTLPKVLAQKIRVTFFHTIAGASLEVCYELVLVSKS